VVLVDNDPAHPSGEALAHEFPEALLLRSPRNLGYTGGNNLGIRRLLEEGVPYIQILNNDTEVVRPAYLSDLVRALEENPRWGIAGPRVFRNAPGRVERTWFPALSLPRVLAWSLGFEGETGEPGGGRPAEVEVVSGVCFLARAELFREVGLFDEALFMYGEETDLCERARRAGWRAAYVPVDSVVHHRAPGRPGSFDLANTLARANSVRYLRKHRGRASAAAAALWLAGTGIARAALGAGPGLRAYLVELAAAARGRPACVS
jgi:hypothetical protein